MSTNDTMLGLGLVLVLAVTAQLVARPLRIPAIVVLLPAGFLAGAATDTVHPDALLGSLYQPLVSIAVGIILFEAGLRLTFDEVVPDVRKAVVRLVLGGVLITWVCIAATTALLFRDMDRGSGSLVGAILVVSGPTVVLPLLAFIRPTQNVRSILKWEGTLVDPIGALLGVLVFAAVKSGDGLRPDEMLVDLSVGALVAAVAVPNLLFLLVWAHRGAPRMVVPVTLMVVVAAVVAADLIRDDTGLMAAVLLGIAVGNQRTISISLSLYEFQETLVQLLIGVLFISVAASVSPSDVRSVLPQALVLVAVMVLLVRPAVVAVTMARSSASVRERAFVAWMAPRGIVAGATAAAFGPELARRGVPGAADVLPIVFVAIFGTVVVYGLTASPVARLLGVAGTGHKVVLVVGGHRWARDIAAALLESGVAVRIWAGPDDHRTAARAAGIEADRGRIMLNAVSREAELEEITEAFLLTASDDFNTLCAAELRDELGEHHVYRVAPHPDEPELFPPSNEAGTLGNSSLTYADLDRRLAAGARIATMPGGELVGPGAPRAGVPLFSVTPDRRLRVATDDRPLRVRAEDTVTVLLGAD